MKPYVNKNDAADAEAICEAAQRPEMRFAALKSKDAQGMLSLHRTRKLLVKQRTGQLPGAEFGVVAPQNRASVNQLVIRDDSDDRLPDEARLTMKTLVDLPALAEDRRTGEGLAEVAQRGQPAARKDPGCRRGHCADGGARRWKTVPQRSTILGVAGAAAGRYWRQGAAWENLETG